MAGHPLRDRRHGDGSIAKITINRPEVRNAFRPETCVRCQAAFELARDDPEVGVIILTGEGPLAFCSGGDQRVRGDDGYVDDDGIGRLNVLDLQIQIRRLPKPVIAMVAGYAIGGGHVLHLVCDLTIAADNARFGQTGPGWAPSTAATAPGCWPASSARRRPRRSGSCATSTTPQAGAGHGPGQHGRAARRRSRTRRWRGAARCSSHSPLALRCSRPAFNADTDGLAGIQQLAGDATLLYYLSRGGPGGQRRLRREAQARLLRFPKRP